MRWYTVLAVLVALVVLTTGSAVFAQCEQPPYGKVVNLANVTMPGGGNMVEVGQLVDSRITRIQVPKDGNFAVEQVGGDAFWVEYRVLAYCKGSEWIPVQDTKLDIRRTEKQPEPIQLPPTRVVKKGESWQEIAKEAGVSEEDIKRFNQATGRKPKADAKIFMAQPSDVLRTWNFANGDPAGIELKDQLRLMNVPEQVRAQWESIIGGNQPDSVWMYSTESKPLVLDALIFGGRFSKDVKSWGRTVCYWKDAKNHKPIDRLVALQYDPVDLGDYRYYLYQFVDCQNGAFVRVPLSYEGSTDVTIQQPPPVSTAAPPTQTVATPITAPPETSHNFVQGGVWWLDYRLAYADVRDDAYQHSVFGGLEWLPRISGYDGWGPFCDMSTVIRVEQAVMDKNHVSGEYRLGGRAWILGDLQGLWRTGFEPGAWYLSSQREYVQYTNVTPTLIHAQEKAKYFDGYGWYGRILGITPQLGYYEMTYKRGTNLDYSLGGNYTVEPGKFYFRASYDRALRKEQARHFDGQTLSFSADTMRVFEGRIGIKPVDKLVLYASYDSWSYDSQVWSFDWNGPGAGFEYRFNRYWRIKGLYKFMNDTTDRNLTNGEVTHTDRHWFGIGLDHGW
ncbi:MAG: hypothetical protein PHI73_05265 [Patescibacteria group bacterium]|nr:hypothetical protein [Patescibacteria group bacterium]